jgi:hypothetical protein
MDGNSFDWAALAVETRALKSLLPDCVDRVSVAIEQMLGEDLLCKAAEYYIEYSPVFELPRQILIQVRPRSVMRYCYEIVKNDRERNRRLAALSLLGAVADCTTLPWIGEFISDSDGNIRMLGIEVLDQLLFTRQITAVEASELITQAKRGEDAQVRERAMAIESIWNGRMMVPNGLMVSTDE